jgi:O-antigen/teichoic acid export membrane protein
MSLHRKMAQGAFWSLLEKGGQQGMSFVIFMVLARLLGPAEYGLANICFVYFVLTTMIVTGLVDGIVSLQIEDDLRLSSLFWVVMVIGLGIGLLCAGTAEPLAAFMREPRLAGLLYWFSSIPLLVALSAVPNLLILKELDFKIYAVRTLVAMMIGGVVGIFMASRGFGAYAIIGQQIAFYAVTNLVVWRSITWRPRLLFNLDAFREAATPGVGVTGVNVLGFLDGQAPRLLIGKILGPVSLGDFALATRLRYTLMEILVTSPLTVLYPGLAKLGGDKAGQKKLAGAIGYIGAFVVFPTLAIAAALAPQYVPLLFGEKWVPAVTVLQIYIIAAASGPSITIAQQLFRAHGKLRIFFPAGAFFITINLLMTLLLFHDNGLVWMSVGTSVSSFLSIPVYFWILERNIGISMWRSMLGLWGPAIAAILSFLSIYAYQNSVYLCSNRWLALITAGLIGAASYSAFCLLFQRRRIWGVIGMLKRMRQRDGEIMGGP